MGLVRAVGCVISMAFFVLGRGLVSCSCLLYTNFAKIFKTMGDSALKGRRFCR